MTKIEQFTTVEFEKALVGILDGTAFSALGILDGEYTYAVSVENTNKRLLIRSSIDVTGRSAASGEDSIRIWVEYWHKKAMKWRSLGKDSKAWTTRLPGWEERLKDRLHKCREIALADKPKPKEGAEICPRCGAGMILRKNRHNGNQFWGCSTFPRCRGTKSYIERTETVKKSEAARKFIPSKYQNAVKDFMLDKSGNLVVKAAPGSGKSKTMEWVMGFLEPGQDVVYLAFNARIVRDFDGKIDPAIGSAATTHSLGLKNITTALGKVRVDEYKDWNLFDEYIEALYGLSRHDEAADVEIAKSAILRLVSLLKADLREPTEENMTYICDRWGIDANSLSGEIVGTVKTIFNRSIDQKKVIGFDDMIYFSAVGIVPCKRFDYIFIDETQDLNKAQIAFVLKSVKDTGRVTAVGDEWQSIYGFRGADTQAMQNTIDALKAKVLPLSVTYRCPKSHVRLIKSRFPDIEMEPAPWAEEGILGDLDEYKFLQVVKPGDLVLCRCNAPLVKPAFSLIRKGVKAVILGRNIGKNLTNLIQKAQKRKRVRTLCDTLEALSSYGQKEIAKLLRMKKNMRAESLQDRIDTIFALSDGCDTVSEINSRIRRIFANDAEGVTFSSIHKAKGGEANRVFILRPDLLPHPMARKDWEREQERNVELVALSRAKQEMYFVRKEEG